ncbi:MAG: sigma-54 dependent transcriptional regulator [Proteobacteria bacterium]|jgi:DNA-binding NtrC family response regulator|nr:sigma-54 dependent transcriptional regulator [Pseudomonadota bacterium]
MNDLNFLQNSFDKPTYPTLVIVEDDNLLGITLKKYLERTFGLSVKLYTSSEDCLVEFSKNHNPAAPFFLLADISLGQGSDGLLLIDILKERGFNFVSVIMTGFASIETAIAATKRGAFHYLTKPFELDVLKQLVFSGYREKLGVELGAITSSTAEEQATSAAPRLRARPAMPKHKIEKPGAEDIFFGIVGRSPAMKEVFARIEKVAKSDSTILITGASGTGKELVANAIHKLSPRSGAPRVSVNCGAIPGELLESELFGHIKGSFTGAISNRKGRFEIAHQGSMFLDEIGDMPLMLQVKLLRVLQLRQIEPVGSSEAIDVDVRVIAATHRDLDLQVKEGKFREDLFYRLNVIPIHVPDLKQRREDIPLLISYFLDRFTSADRSNEISFSHEAMDLLMSYEWPGNVRELENVIERLVILRGGNEILPEDLPSKIYRTNPLVSLQYKTLFELPDQGVDLKTILSDIEDSLILQALGRTGGNKNQASKLLSLNRTTLIEKMKKKGIELGGTDA